MIEKFKKALISEQHSVLSAASVIASMIILAQVFGLVRQWIILKFLGSDMFSLYLSAFRLPDLVFEVFAFGAFSSAFIPVFSKYLENDHKKAWDIAARTINIGLLIFGLFALVFGAFSYQFYSVVAFGFNSADTFLVSSVARIIFLAQGLFVISYVLTGVLESSKRFLVPALAPVFYNLGIIVGTLIFYRTFGIYAPALGVVIGASMHLAIQLPVARKLGFRFTTEFKVDEGVKEIGKLAAPRFIDLASLQVQKSAELFFASLMTTASYGYLSLANSIQAIPTMLFGVSLAKAALVSLSREQDDEKFRNVFSSTLNQMMFIIIPISALITVLKIPIVRLTFGTSHSLDWTATIQISMALSAFAIGIPLQGALAVISRAFYAKSDTKTPVALAVVDVLLTIILEIIFIIYLKLPIWSVALANTLAAFIQVFALYVLLMRKIQEKIIESLIPIFKSIVFSLISASIVSFAIKFFDMSVWVKKISFISNLNVPFESFVLDTRYTWNLVLLTFLVSFTGIVFYLALSYLTKSKELFALLKIFSRRKGGIEINQNESVTLEIDEE